MYCKSETTYCKLDIFNLKNSYHNNENAKGIAMLNNTNIAILQLK